MTAETTQALEPYVAGMTWGWTGVRGTWAKAEASESFRAMAGEFLREAYRLRAGQARTPQLP